MIIDLNETHLDFIRKALEERVEKRYRYFSGDARYSSQWKSEREVFRRLFVTKFGFMNNVEFKEWLDGIGQ